MPSPVATLGVEVALPVVIDELRATLKEEPFFDGAARLVLQSVLAVLDETLPRTGYQGSLELQRAIFHLRSEPSYRSIVMVEQGGAENASRPKDANAEALAASSTAWDAVQDLGSAVTIDVAMGLVRPAHRVSGGRPTSGPMVSMSRHSGQLFAIRSATHAYAIPVRNESGAVCAMITVDIGCRSAMGRSFPALNPLLQQMVDAVGPSLLRKPHRRTAAPLRDDLLPVVGPTIEPVIETLATFARFNDTILLKGPSGAGKTRLAQWCHERSNQRRGPFERANLLTASGDMAGAELFGWERGAFTGAHSARVGHVARAEGGTLFIDEIDKLSVQMQRALLELLDTRTYRVLGDSGAEREANVRFIVATNANLPAAIRRGDFLEDLYYRISAFPINVPSLDDRRDEISEWATFLVQQRHEREAGEDAVVISANVRRRLSAMDWPGNIRQLGHVVGRCYAFAQLDGVGTGEIRIDDTHLDRALRHGDRHTGGEMVTTLRQAARSLVRALEKRSDGGNGPPSPAKVFTAYVLDEAIGLYGLEKGLELLGSGALLRNRNHNAKLNAAKECRSEFEGWLETGDGSSDVA